MSSTFPWSAGDSRTLTHRFTAADVERFTELTGDRNPVHVDPAYARQTALGTPVVHGMLAASFVSTLVGMQLPGPGALWTDFAIAWRKPIRIGVELRITATVTAVHPALRTLDLIIAGEGTSDGDQYFEAKARVTMTEQGPPREAAEGLAGKRALITGAGGDVGSAIAQALTDAEARVIPWGRQVVDLRDAHAVDRAIARELENDPIDIFVHAAAPPARALAVDDAAWGDEFRAHWEIVVDAFGRISRAILPRMRKGGSIVGLLTQYVLDAPPAKLSSYVSAKMGLWGLIRALAVEYGPSGIRVNAVSPSMMSTAYTAEIPLRTKQVEAAKSPLRRLCEPADVAATVAYLCGPGAAYITGVNVPVTGGASMP